MRIIYHRAYDARGWFDPTLTPAGWLDDELTDGAAPEPPEPPEPPAPEPPPPAVDIDVEVWTGRNVRFGPPARRRKQRADYVLLLLS